MARRAKKVENVEKNDLLSGDVVEMQQPVTNVDSFSVTELEDVDSQNDVVVGVFKIDANAKMPTKGSEKSSCYDLCAFLPLDKEVLQVGEDNKDIPTVATRKGVTIYPGARALIPTGLKFDIPDGYDIRVYSRSGYSFTNGIMLVNGVGIIDSDYRGELMISIINNTQQNVRIADGTRIAQFEINKLSKSALKVVTEYDENASARGDSGFGSTGVL